MRDSGLPNIDGRVWSAPIGRAIEMTERGLVYSGGALLVRMRTTAEGAQQLATGADRERMLAMLSVAFGRPVVASEVIPHVETAAEHWRRGEQVEALGRDDFHGVWVKYGTPGSVRADVVHPNIERPHTIGDYKTGSARLSESRKQDFRTHLPKLDDDNEVEIHEIR